MANLIDGLTGVHVRSENVSFTAEDGWSLHGTLFSSPHRRVTSAVKPTGPKGLLVNSATGIPRSFYSCFASFVAHETGWPVLTYDYRGNEGVLPETKRKRLRKHPLVDVNADISDWAFLDQPAALSYLLTHLRRDPSEEDTRIPSAVLEPEVVIVGHSVGGRIVPLLPPHLAAFVSRVLLVAVNCAYFRYFQGIDFAKLRVAMQMLITKHGYAPTQKLSLPFGELPSGVATQWLRWASHPNDYFSEPKLRERGEAWPGYVLSISFDDDEISLPAAFPAFTDLLKSAHVVNIHLKPLDVGLEGRVGHVGFFHSRVKEVLWRPVLEYLVDNRVASSLLKKSTGPVRLSKL